MMLMLLLTELTRLDVQLFTEPGELKVDAPVGSLTDEVRKAMMEHKAALLRYAVCPYVETIDGLGMLTGHRQEFGIIDFVAPERKERLRYKIGVRLVHDGVEQFYLPGTVWEAERKESETSPNKWLREIYFPQHYPNYERYRARYSGLPSPKTRRHSDPMSLIRYANEVTVPDRKKDMSFIHTKEIPHA